MFRFPTAILLFIMWNMQQIYSLPPPSGSHYSNNDDAIGRYRKELLKDLLTLGKLHRINRSLNSCKFVIPSELASNRGRKPSSLLMEAQAILEVHWSTCAPHFNGTTRDALRQFLNRYNEFERRIHEQIFGSSVSPSTTPSTNHPPRTSQQDDDSITTCFLSLYKFLTSLLRKSTQFLTQNPSQPRHSRIKSFVPPIKEC